MFLLQQWNIETLPENFTWTKSILNVILNKIEDRESILSSSDKDIIDVWGIMLMPGRELILWWLRILVVIFPDLFHL